VLPKKRKEKEKELVVAQTNTKNDLEWMLIINYHVQLVNNAMS
jgi:hypothetical protein